MQDVVDLIGEVLRSAPELLSCAAHEQTVARRADDIQSCLHSTRVSAVTLFARSPNVAVPSDASVCDPFEDGRDEHAREVRDARPADAGAGRSPMRRRLRKKKHVGEFRELGFEVRATLREALTPVEHEAFLDEWIDVVEARNLAFGGGGGYSKFEGFVTNAAPASTTDEDRRALAAFLAGHHAVNAREVGTLVDAWR